MKCEYWKDIVAKLKTHSNWASHVLSTSEDDYFNLSEALKCVSEEEIIENTLFAYEDLYSQPYCDDILSQFDKQKISEIFKNIQRPTENMKNSIMRFLEL